MVKIISNIEGIEGNANFDVPVLEPEPDNIIMAYRFSTLQELVKYGEILNGAKNISYIHIPCSDQLINKFGELAIELCKQSGGFTYFANTVAKASSIVQQLTVSEQIDDAPVDDVMIKIEDNADVKADATFVVEDVSVRRYMDEFRSNIVRNRMGKTYFAELGFRVSKWLTQAEYVNNYFDKVFVLNIERRADRWERTSQLLQQNGIFNAERFIGYDGSEQPHKQEWSRYMKQPLSVDEAKIHQKGIKSAGSWAILKSMKRLIEQAKNKGYRKILTLQDDILFHKQFLDKFYETLTVTIPSNWKLMYLGASQHSWKSGHVTHGKGFYRCYGMTDGAFAVAIDSSVYDALLDEIDKFVLPFDTGALCAVQRKFGDDCYVVSPNLIIADVRDSDLRKSRDLDATSKGFKWNLSDYVVLDQLKR